MTTGRDRLTDEAKHGQEFNQSVGLPRQYRPKHVRGRVVAARLRQPNGLANRTFVNTVLHRNSVTRLTGETATATETGAPGATTAGGPGVSASPHRRTEPSRPRATEGNTLPAL